MAWPRSAPYFAVFEPPGRDTKTHEYTEPEASPFTKCSILYLGVKVLLVNRLDLGLYGEAVLVCLNCMSKSAWPMRLAGGCGLSFIFFLKMGVISLCCPGWA